MRHDNNEFVAKIEHLRSNGEKWKDIAAALGYANKNAIMNAYRFAKKRIISGKNRYNMGKAKISVPPSKRLEILFEKWENDEWPEEAKFCKSGAIDYVMNTFNCSGSCASHTVNSFCHEYDIHLEKGFKLR